MYKIGGKDKEIYGEFNGLLDLLEQNVTKFFILT